MITQRESFEESDDRQFADYCIDRNGSPVNRDENEQLHKLNVSGSIATEYAEFCVRCDRAKLPLLCLEDYIKQYCR